MKSSFLVLFLLFLFSSCTPSDEDSAWEIAKQSATNSKELTYFLNYYKTNGNSEKYKAACYLIANMPNKYSISGKGKKRIYDINIVKADSLIRSLEYSFHLRETSPFLKAYTFKQFCEYILPYRIANEPLQYYWKWDCANYFGNGNSNNIINAARNINEKVKLNLAPEFYKDSLQAYSSLIKNRYGKCDDRSVLAVMALRAVGIPAAFELVPYWGSNNNAHSFASVILPNDSVIPFQDSDEDSRNGLPIRKMPKIYRKVYSITPHTFDTPAIYPELFSNNDIIDVTQKHKIGSKEVRLDSLKGRTAYLSVFSPTGWIPIATSKDGYFPYVGTGSQIREEDSREALNLGKGILYVPFISTDNKLYPASAPLIVSDKNTTQLVPDTTHTETVILTRKYPLNKRIVRFARHMIGGIFEGANQKDFADAKEICRITDTPQSKMQKIHLTPKPTYRSVRYRTPKGVFCIAELSLYRPNGKVLTFSPIACEAISEDSTMSVIFDKDPLTYYQVDGGIDLWVGADLHTPKSIGAIGFAPRNDDNAVVPNDTYELFYWNGRWHSLGKQISHGDSLMYDNVPKHSLLWLRNLTKGREERPFTYENGKQIWW